MNQGNAFMALKWRRNLLRKKFVWKKGFYWKPFCPFWPGVPLSLIGMVSYGLVAALGVQLTRKSLPFGWVESDGRQILLWSTTSMAAASAYFLYILTTKLSGTSCSYCLFSVLLSFSLFGITLKVSFFFFPSWNFFCYCSVLLNSPSISK